MKLLSTLLAVGIAVGCTGCSSGPAPIEDASSYTADIMRARQEKDAMFRSADDSPLPAETRASFAGLSYFPIDASYHVPANLDRTGVDTSLVLELSTSLQTKRRVRRVGVLTFALPNAPALKLSAFVEVDSADLTRLFVPFTDQTSGRETYGGGRYLELTKTPTGLYDLDFNRAYHPFCLFNTGYECPVPPKENRLDVAVRAGERLPPAAPPPGVAR